MPNKKSTIKRVKQNEKRRIRNRSIKSRVKTFMKKLQSAIESKQVEEAKTCLREFSSSIDKAIKSNIYHKNTAARYKSRLMKRLAALQQ